MPVVSNPSDPPSPLPMRTPGAASAASGWPLLWPALCAALVPTAVSAWLAGQRVAAALLLLAMAGCVGWAWRRHAAPAEPPADEVRAAAAHGATPLAALWAMATVGLYPLLDTGAAALHLVMLAGAGGMALVAVAASPRVHAKLALGCFGALPLAALRGAWPATWPLLLAGGMGLLAWGWTTWQARTSQALAAVAAQARHDQAQARVAGAVQVHTRQLAEVGHELRTPMAGMLGVLALLDRTPMPTQQRHLVSLLRTSGEGLMTLLDDLLDQARIEADRLVLRLSPVSPQVLATAAVALFEPSARAKGLALRLSVHGVLPEAVLLDAQRLRQVLLNLLGNALKFTDHGEVRLELSAVPRPDGQVLLRWAVHDTGIGIAPADMGRVFEPFEQVAGHHAAGGSGLGLALSRRLVRAMGGDITLASSPGQGSRFAFALPVPLVTLPTAAAPAVLAPLRGKVLLAEGDPLSSHLCAELLRGFGLQVRAVTTDAQAQAALHVGRFDLLLIDARLPGLDAPRLFAAWRLAQGVDLTSPVPAVLLSDEHDDSCAARAEWPVLRDAGFCARLVRPYLGERVHALVACWLDGARGGGHGVD